MCNDESASIRKLALSNLHPESQNFSEFISRIRDADPDIGCLLIKKLIAKQIWLPQVSKLSDVYKLIHDGVFSRHASLQKDCLTYLKQSFAQSSMDLEEIAQKDAFELLREKVQTFLTFLSLETCLLYPNIQKAVDHLIVQYLLEALDSEERKVYFNELLQIMYDKGHITSEELYLLAVLCKHEEASSLYNVIVDKFPTGSAFAYYLTSAFKEKKGMLNAFACLSIANEDINNDEFSRRKINEVIIEDFLKLSRTAMRVPLPNYELLGSNDVFFEQTESLLNAKKMGQNANASHKILENESDLVPLACAILKKNLSPEGFIQQIIESVDHLEVLSTQKKQSKAQGLDTRCFIYKLIFELMKSTKSEQISSIVKKYISNSFKTEQEPVVKDILMQNLFVYCYHNQHFCQEYTQNIIQAIKAINLLREPESNEIGMFIGLFDLIMVHKNNVCHDFQYLVDVLLICMLKSHGQLRQICIEGFCKILINDIYANPSQLLTILLILWNDKNQDEVSIQILSTFFYQYTRMSLTFCKHFEQGLEGIVCISTLLYNKQQAISQNYINIQIHDIDQLSKILKVGVGLLSYGFQAGSQTLQDLQQDQKVHFHSIQSIGPQEEFFAFMCKVNSLEFSQVFEKILDSFDFFKFLNDRLLNILRVNLAPVLEKSMEESGLKRKQFFNDVLKYLKADDISKIKDASQMSQGFDAHFDKKLQQLNDTLYSVYKNLEDVGIIITQEDNEEYFHKELQFEKRHFGKE